MSIYLVQPSEYVVHKINVYKFGFTRNNDLSRLKAYGKNTKIIYTKQISCFKTQFIETIIIQQLKKTFPIYKGNEYFQGCYKKMKRIIKNTLRLYFKNVDNMDELYDLNISDDSDNENNTKQPEIIWMDICDY
jgi:hypothetical protein